MIQCTKKRKKKKKEKKVFTWAIWGSWSFSLITVMPEVRIGSQTGTRTWVSLLTSSDTCEGHAENVIYEYLAEKLILRQLHNSSKNIHDTIYWILFAESNPVLMPKQGNKMQISQRIVHCDWLMNNSNTKEPIRCRYLYNLRPGVTLGRFCVELYRRTTELRGRIVIQYIFLCTLFKSHRHVTDVNVMTSLTSV